MQIDRKTPQFLWSALFSIKTAPGYATLLMLTDLVKSVIPSINVILVAGLGAAMASGQDVTSHVIKIGLVFGLGIVLNSLYQNIVLLARVQINMITHVEYNNKLAQVPAPLYQSHEFMDKTRGALQAIQERKISEQFYAIESLFFSLVTAVLLGATLWSFNKWVGLISIIVPIPSTIAMLQYAKVQEEYWPRIKKDYRRGKYYQDQLYYQRTGMELASMHASTKVAALSEGVRQRRTTKEIHLEWAFLYSVIAASIFTGILFMVALYIMFQNNEISAIFASLSGLIAGLQVMHAIGFRITDLMKTLPASRNYRAFLELDIQAQQPIITNDINSVAFNDVKVYYGDKLTVKGVDLELRLGSFTALVGENGSGKTSFLRAIMGMQAQAEGAITINGTQHYQIADKNYYLPYLSVNQEYGRFEMTIRQFLLLGSLLQPSDAEIWQALDKVEMADFVRDQSKCLETMLGTQFGELDLSGGQWQRLVIARSFLSHNKVIYLDEPTSAIDANTEEAIFGYLHEESKQRFILLTSHRVSTLKQAAMIYVMDNGSIIEQGSYQELNRPGTHFYKLFESQLDY